MDLHKLLTDAWRSTKLSKYEQDFLQVIEERVEADPRFVPTGNQQRVLDNIEKKVYEK